MSPRHLTRVFRQATGISIEEYATRLRLELARNLLHDPHLTVEAVAARCGLRARAPASAALEGDLRHEPGPGAGGRRPLLDPRTKDLSSIYI